MSQPKLVEIESEEENTAVYDEALKQFGQPANIWMGLTDRGTEGDWRLDSTGEPPVYTKWGEGEPNSSGDEDCAHFYATHEPYTWNDLECSRGSTASGFPLYVFCEK